VRDVELPISRAQEREKRIIRTSYRRSQRWGGKKGGGGGGGIWGDLRGFLSGS